MSYDFLIIIFLLSYLTNEYISALKENEFLMGKISLWTKEKRKQFITASKIDLLLYVFFPALFTGIPLLYEFNIFEFEKNINFLNAYFVILIVTYIRLTKDYMDNIKIKDMKNAIYFLLWVALLMFILIFVFSYAIFITKNFIVVLMGAIYVLAMSIIIFKKIVDSYETLNIYFLLVAIMVVALLDNGELFIFGTYNLMKESVSIESWYGWMITGIEQGANVVYKVDFSEIHLTKEEQVIQYCFGRFLNTSIFTTLAAYMYFNKK